MGALTTALGGIIALLGRKASVIAVTLSAFVVLTAAFIASINALVSSMSGYLAVPTWVLNGVGMFLPTNFAVVVGAIFAARISRAAYDLAMLKMQAINSAQ